MLTGNRKFRETKVTESRENSPEHSASSSCEALRSPRTGIARSLRMTDGSFQKTPDFGCLGYGLTFLSAVSCALIGSCFCPMSFSWPAHFAPTALISMVTTVKFALMLVPVWTQPKCLSPSVEPAHPQPITSFSVL